MNLRVGANTIVDGTLDVGNVATFLKEQPANTGDTDSNAGTLVKGGLAVAMNVWVGTSLNVDEALEAKGAVSFRNLSPATNSGVNAASGAGTILKGGLAVAKNAWIGTSLNIDNKLIVDGQATFR